MNILKNFDDLKKYCESRWENMSNMIGADGNGLSQFYCNTQLTDCNEHVCPLINHFCAHCGESHELWKIANDFKRECIRELLEQCTEKQIDLFNRMYKSIEHITEDKMYRAYDQCLQTILNKDRTSCAKSPAQNTMEICHTAPNSAMLQGLKPHAGGTGTSA